MNRNSSECALCSGPSLAAAAKDPVLPGEKARSEFWLGFPCGKHQVMVCACFCVQCIAWSCLLPHAPCHIWNPGWPFCVCLAVRLYLFGLLPVAAVQFAWCLTCKLNVFSWL